MCVEGLGKDLRQRKRLLNMRRSRVAIPRAVDRSWYVPRVQVITTPLTWVVITTLKTSISFYACTVPLYSYLFREESFSLDRQAASGWSVVEYCSL